MTILLAIFVYLFSPAQIEHAERANYELKCEYARLTREETLLERRIEDMEFETILRRMK